MKNKYTFISLVPARAGSKGLINKNMRLLNNKPLIHFTLAASDESKYISDTFVSSNSNEILDYARNFKKVKTIKRPAKFSQDNSLANDVIKHFLQISNFDKTENIYIVYLQPTSPLRNKYHIDQAIDSLISRNAKSLISVRRSKETPYKAMAIKNKLLQPLLSKEKLNENRQNLNETFYPNGAIYIFNIRDFIENQYKIPMVNSLPFHMSIDESIDIDNEEDLI